MHFTSAALALAAATVTHALTFNPQDLMALDRKVSGSFDTINATTVGHPINSCGRGDGHNCPADMCCSSSGWCGTSEQYCGEGCKPEFGICGVRSQRCGEEHGKCPTNQCCSNAGYCGVGADYCMVPNSCQHAYGRCDSDVMPKGPSTSSDPRPKRGRVPYGKIIDRCTVPGTIALTYDDGPSEFTGELLSLLKDAKAKATFFMGGTLNGQGPIDETPGRADIIRMLDAEGHMIASHTWSHPNMDSITSDERRLEMFKSERAFANVLGKYPAYMRPPYLNCSQHCMKDMSDLGYHIIGYEVDSSDWTHPEDLMAMSEVIDAAFDHAGDSMLMIQHDTIKASAVELTKYILYRAYEKGWRAVTVAECLGSSVKHAYRVPKTKGKGSKGKGPNGQPEESKGTKLRPW